MITELSLIRNIGQFDSFSWSTLSPLGKLALIYAENGRGKTTLTEILRSLAAGDSAPIDERWRLSSANPPHVVIQCNDNRLMFQDGSWDGSMPRIRIFNDDFVDQNIYSGLAVDAHHRQNLHELILGEEAVAISHELDALIARIEEHNAELRSRERAIPKSDRGPFSIRDFCFLEPRDDIDASISEAERALAAAEQQAAVAATPGLEPVLLPEIDAIGVKETLGKDLSTLDQSAMDRVQGHLSSLGQGAEGWVSDGMRRLSGSDGQCPFCTQSLEAV